MANFRSWITHHERMVGIIIVLTLTVLIGIRFWWLGETRQDGSPDTDAVWRSILTGLITTIIVTTFVTLAVRYTSPPREIADATSYIQSHDISTYLEDAARSTKEWAYYGHTGRYVRSAIFPILLEKARAGRAINVRMLILDPGDDHLCEYYARYRNAARTAKRGTPWSKETVKSELLATVLAAMELRASSASIDMEIGFVKQVSLFRIDLATDRLLITQEDTQEPALGYESASRFYEYYRRDVMIARDQARRLNQLGPLQKFSLADRASCLTALASTGLDLISFPDPVVSEAFKKATERVNPYG